MAHPVRAGAQEFSHDGGTVGVLLCHGFTGSPASMLPWAQSLVDAPGHDFTVRVPRLPGHGTHWRDLNATVWQDWYETVDTELSLLRARCDHVVVGGLSMGGALALRLAEQRPADVDGLVLVNPAVQLRRRDLRLVPLLSRVVPSIPGIGNDIARADADEISYDRTPLRALASQLQLWRDVREHLDQVQCPILYLRSAVDHVVDDSSHELILARIPAERIEFVVLTKSFHVATLDHDADLIASRSIDFIGAVTAPPPSPQPSAEESPA